MPLLLLLVLLLPACAPASQGDSPSPVYPACSSDSDCYDHEKYRCVGCRYNASEPAGVCNGVGGAHPKATCQCMLEAPGDQCGPTGRREQSKLPSYLMVGDSISMGMVSGGKLFDALNTTVQPVHSPGNACNANRGAHCIDNWLDSCAFDIVSFNFGIHDTSRNQEHLTLPVYKKMLGAVTDSLLKCRANASRTAKLLYVLTTPVPTNKANASKPTSECLNSDVIKYNAAASSIMAAAKIPVLDMFGFVNAHCGAGYETCDWSPGSGNVHFNDVGWEAMAGKMAAAIRGLLSGDTAEPSARGLSRLKADDDEASDSATTPVSKSVGWFVGGIHDLNGDGASAFLTSSNLTDRILPCCNSLEILPNGSLGPQHYGNMSHALYGEKTEILIDLGGTAAVVPTIAARREAFAQEVLDLAHAMDVSGFTMDWEFGAAMNWSSWNDTMSHVADVLHRDGKKLGVCIQTGCGDNLPSWRGNTNPPCATLFRDMPWADKLTDMGTYNLGGNTTASRHEALALHECPSPVNKITKWCGLEGQVLNHLQPLAGTDPPEYKMRVADGQYSVGLSPNTCTGNGTVAGGWTDDTLHAFLLWLDTVGVRSIDIWCGGGVVGGSGGCNTLSYGVHGVAQPCTWFLRRITEWRFNASGTRIKSDDSSCTFIRHSYIGKSLGGRPVVPANNQTQCCEICRSLPACEAAGLDSKAGRCYPVANVSGWESDPRYVGCVPSGAPTGHSFTFATADTLALTFDEATLALRNVTVVVDGARQGLLHTDDPWQSKTGFPLWRVNVSDCSSPVEYPLTATSAGSAASALSHTVVAGVLVLKWTGVPLPEPLTGTIDVEVTATPRPNGKGLALRGSVSQSQGVSSSSVCSHAFALPSLDSMFLRGRKHEQLFVPNVFGHVGQCHGNHMQCTMAKLGGSSGSMSPGENPEWMHHTGGGISPEHMYMPSGASRSMQFYALLSNFTGTPLGLYIGAHDPRSRLQLLLLEGLYADEPGCTNASTLAEGSPTACGRAAMQWHHFPDRMKVDLSVGSYSMDYDLVIEGFAGDWFSASRIYRAWVVEEAVWTRHGTLKQRVARGEYPSWLLDTHLWVSEQKMGDGTKDDPRKSAPAFTGANPDDPLRWDQPTNTSIPNGTVTTLKAIRSILGSDFCAEWSGYDTGAFDTKDGPDGWIPRPGFAAAVKEAQAAGVRIIPYTNGRIDDPNVPSFETDGAIRYMCNGSAGPYREEFNAFPRNISFFVPDPGALYWQEQMGRVAQNLAISYGTDGLYVDQYASMWAQPCNGQAGSHWADGVRAVFETQRHYMGHDKIVISESNAEAYIGSLHANLALYGWANCGFVPAFQSLYGGMTLNVGIGVAWPGFLTVNFSNPDSIEHTDMISWRAALAHQLVYGSVLSWQLAPQFLYIMQHSPEHLQFVKDAIALRKSAGEYLVHGRVMRPPTVLGPPLPTVTWYTSAVVPHTYNAYPPCAVPVVVANSFKADNGSFALILANHGLKDVHYHARIKLDEDYDNSKRDDEPPPRQATVSLTIKAMEVLAVPLEPDSDGAM